MPTSQDDIIRASEIGLYVFCARAWRLKADGYESENRAEMAAGAETHELHGQRVAGAQTAQRLSGIFLAIALLLLGLLLLAIR